MSENRCDARKYVFVIQIETKARMAAEMLTKNKISNDQVTCISTMHRG